MLPEARCYAILRDACDVIALQMSASIREIRMGYPPTMLAPGTVAGDSDEEEIWHSGAVVDALADRFLSYYDETVLSTWHLVSYEALVTSPRLSIDRLRAASGLDLEFDPTEEWHGVEFDYLRGSRTAESAWRSDLWGQPVNTSRVGYHRRTLPAAQVQRIERRCGGYLARWRSLTRASDPRPATTVLEDQAR